MVLEYTSIVIKCSCVSAQRPRLLPPCTARRLAPPNERGGPVETIVGNRIRQHKQHLCQRNPSLEAPSGGGESGNAGPGEKTKKRSSLSNGGGRTSLRLPGTRWPGRAESESNHAPRGQPRHHHQHRRQRLPHQFRCHRHHRQQRRPCRLRIIITISSPKSSPYHQHRQHHQHR